jgi:hypothetical protein
MNLNKEAQVRSMEDRSRGNVTQMKFESILQNEVPRGRDGKHKTIIRQLLSDLEQLSTGSALKIPISELPDKMENIRSALNRATRQRGLEVATSSDSEFLYVWNIESDARK